MEQLVAENAKLLVELGWERKRSDENEATRGNASNCNRQAEERERGSEEEAEAENLSSAEN